MGALADEYILVRADVSRIPRDVQKAGKSAGRQFGGAFSGAAKGLLAGAALLGGLTAATGFLKGANAEARESAKVGKVTAQVIKSTGGAAKLTADQVGALATSISNATGKDDELVQSGANLLLTFKNVRNETGKGSDIFNRATKAAVDLSATGFGSITGSSKMLGKALNDPVKGITALQRAGVTFSDQQREQIRVMVESGNVLGAQKIIMREVESQVGGVAAASADASEKYRVSADNFKELVGGALVPVGDAFYNVMSQRVFPVLTRTIKYLSKEIPAAVTVFRNAFRTGMTEDEGTWLESIALAARSVGQAIQTYAVPALQQLGGFVRAEVLPGLRSLGQYVVSTLLPAWLAWYGFLIKQMMPILKQIGGFVVTQVVPALGVVARFIASDVVPGFLSIVDTVKALIRVVAPIIGQLVGVVLGKFREMSPEVKSIWNSVKEIITGVMFIVKEVIQAVTTIIRLIWDRHGESIKKIVGGAFGAIFKTIAGVMKAIAGVIKLFVALIKGDWKGAWTAIKQIFSGIWQAIKAILGNILGQIHTVIGGALTRILTRWFGFWTRMRTQASNSINAVRTTIATVLSRVRDGVSNAVGAIGRAWDGIREKFRAPVNWIINNVLQKLVNAYDKIAGIIGATKIGALPRLAGGGLAQPPGRREGGPIPGRGGPRQDNIAGIDRRSGMQTAWVSAKEFVVNAKAYARNRGLVQDINSGKVFDERKEGLATGGLVGYKGGQFTSEFANRLRRVASVVNFNVFQGGWRPATSYSGTSHAGDAVDAGPVSAKLVRAMRAVSIAAWDRTGMGNWAPHVHGVPLPGAGTARGSAVWQAQDYLRGGNGLGGRDNGAGSGGPNAAGALGGLVGGVVNLINPRAMLTKAISGIIKGISDRIPGGKTPFGQLLSGMSQKLVDALKKKLPTSFGDPGTAGATGPGVTGAWSGGGFKGLSASQMRIASTIAQVGRPMGKKAQLIGIIAGLVESRLTNVNFGDRDSLGVFQQRAPWGPASVRRNVAASAGMFFHGGRGGQRGLDDINWQGMSPGSAAQAVQVSAFPGRYSTQIPLGNAILAALARQSSPLMTGGIVRGGSGGILARIGEGRQDELVQPLPRQWRADRDRATKSDSRPITIMIDLGDGVTQRVEGILDADNEFRTSVGRMRR